MRIASRASWCANNVELFPLTPDLVSEAYVAWLSDPLVNRFLESRFTPQDRDEVEAYVASVLHSDDELFLGIRDVSLDRHVGNIKLAIDPHHDLGEVGILVGDRSVWGQGIASRAISLLIGIARDDLGLRKLSAGCYASNVGSQRAFEKAGFTFEGVRPGHALLDDVPEDLVLMGCLLSSRFETNKDKRSTPVRETGRRAVIATESILVANVKPVQDDIFSESEGNSWFLRNKGSLDTSRAHDVVLSVISNLVPPSSTQSICEVGCTNGWRLATLGEANSSLRLAGFDVSAQAIDDGRQRWPRLDLRVGSAENPPFNQRFDVVLVSFVLHWVDRSRLARSIASIDELVADGGHLIIADFLPNEPCARRYHHRTDVDLFTFKQDYARCFTALEVYRKLGEQLFAHDRAESSMDVDEQDRAACVVLKKSLTAYPLR